MTFIINYPTGITPGELLNLCLGITETQSISGWLLKSIGFPLHR